MFKALRPAWVLSLAGQASTHKAQPVQSSGAIWMVYLVPGNSLNLASMDLKAAGADAAYLESYTLARMTACGQTKTHLPHWMQRSFSQAGISKAMLRFSHLVVPVGKVPSTGKALTGRLSPSPLMIWPSTS